MNCLNDENIWHFEVLEQGIHRFKTLSDWIDININICLRFDILPLGGGTGIATFPVRLPIPPGFGVENVLNTQM